MCVCVCELQRERDAVLQESLQLQTELEEERRQREKDRDEIAELRDRADNLKVQAQGKLVRMPNMYIIHTYYLKCFWVCHCCIRLCMTQKVPRARNHGVKSWCETMYMYMYHCTVKLCMYI